MYMHQYTAQPNTEIIEGEGLNRHRITSFATIEIIKDYSQQKIRVKLHVCSTGFPHNTNIKKEETSNAVSDWVLGYHLSSTCLSFCWKLSQGERSL